MTAAERIANIASRLDAGTRRALVHATVRDGQHYVAALAGVPAILIAAMVHGRGEQLNELGLQVRAHLMEQDA